MKGNNSLSTLYFTEKMRRCDRYLCSILNHNPVTRPFFNSKTLFIDIQNSSGNINCYDICNLWPKGG